MTKSDLKTGMYCCINNKPDLYLFIRTDKGCFLISPFSAISLDRYADITDGNGYYHILPGHSGLSWIKFTKIFERNVGELKYFETVFKYAYCMEYFEEWFKPINITSENTISIGNITYDKQEFENAVKDLKPIK